MTNGIVTSSLHSPNQQEGAKSLLQTALHMQVFTESTHIVAIKTSGNVYAYEAVQELNIKPKLMKDLLTDQPFTRKDIIHIQDPLNLEASMSVSPLPPPCPSPSCPLHRAGSLSCCGAS